MVNDANNQEEQPPTIPAPAHPGLVINQLLLGTEGGGIITAINQWVPLLQQAGWEIRFTVLAEQGQAVNMLRNAGHAPLTRRFRRSARFTKLPAVLGKVGTRIIHVHNPSAQLAATFAGRRIGAAVFRTVHADMFEEMRGALPAYKIALWKKLVAFMINRAAAVGVVSPHLIPLLPTTGSFDKERIRIMPNGFDPAPLENNSNSLSAEVSAFLTHGNTSAVAAPLILAMGRLVPVKNFALLLRAFQSVVKDIPQARLILAGSGPLEVPLKKLAQQLGLENSVLFLAWVDEIAPLVKRATTVVISSVSECCPMIVLEAMSVAKPVVSTAVGGVPYMVEHEKNGLLSPSNDSESLADSIIRIIKDQPLAERLGNANRRTLAERFTPQLAAQQIAAVYNEVAVGIRE